MTTLLCSTATFIFGFLLANLLRDAGDRNRAYDEAMQNHSPKFITPYDDKLIELGVKEQFDTNILNAMQDEGWQLVNKPFMEKAESFHAYVVAAFNWNTTPEGGVFWYNVAIK